MAKKHHRARHSRLTLRTHPPLRAARAHSLLPRCRRTCAATPLTHLHLFAAKKQQQQQQQPAAAASESSSLAAWGLHSVAGKSNLA